MWGLNYIPVYIHGAFQESKANEEMRSITRRRSSLNATKCTHPHQQKVTQPLVESCDAAREELNDRRLIALQKLDSNVVRRAREGDSHTRAKIARLHAEIRALTLKVGSGFVQVVDTQADREHKGSRGAGNCVNSSGSVRCKVPDEQMVHITNSIVLPDSGMDRLLAKIHLADDVKRVNKERQKAETRLK